MWNLIQEYPITFIFIVIFYCGGLICAALALLKARTPQGATAWIMALLTFPFISVPLFFIFGSTKFYGYTIKRRHFDDKIDKKFSSLNEINSCLSEPSDTISNLIKTLTPLTLNQPGFTCKNKVDLLIDGEQTFAAMMTDLGKAQEYIIFQFYVIRVDSVGRKFLDILIDKAKEGVEVTILYDEIGSEIPSKVVDELKSSGIEVCHFNSISGKGKMQVNFRNHRKIIVIDGKVGFVGGFNIGDDYLGLWPSIGYWRDTHLRIEGPSVIAAQLASAKDWYWCRQTPLKAKWEITQTDGNANILVLQSGPADEQHNCLLTHIALVNSASKRLWIANPYFVPPESLLDAIFLAAFRGVDVRIILPSYSDSPAIMLASKVYQERLLKHGIKIFRFEPGFLHQKVMLVDDTFAVIGSANFDFRSMFINFEMTAVVAEEELIQSVQQMLENDFLCSKQVSLNEFKNIPIYKRLSMRGANLLAPLL